jgi:integrase/recombinase XerD
LTALAPFLESLEPGPLRDELETFVARERVAPMTISHAVDMWLDALAGEGKSDRTIATYRRLLDRLADAYPLVSIKEVTVEMLRRFLTTEAQYKDGRGKKSNRTRAQEASIVRCFFAWLDDEGVIRRTPAAKIKRPQLPAAEQNDNVTTISTADALRLLEAANRSKWNRRLAVNLLLGLGPRRGATSRLRVRDYDAENRTVTFHEKGAKTITKPVPGWLADVLDAAIASGECYVDEDSYLIPSDAEQRRAGERDARIILRLVQEVADEAGVECHVHALRAAFATRFLESKPGELVALKDLMGHSRVETTLIYLRRLNRRQAMETVRDFAW